MDKWAVAILWLRYFYTPKLKKRVFIVLALSIFSSVTNIFYWTFLSNHASQPLQTLYGGLAIGPTNRSLNSGLPVIYFLFPGSVHFYAPASIDQGQMVFDLSVCLFFVSKNFLHWPYLWLVRVRTFIFHMSIPCDKTSLFVPSSRSSVKVNVEYQGHNFQKMPLQRHSCFTNTSCWTLHLGIGIARVYLVSKSSQISCLNQL